MEPEFRSLFHSSVGYPVCRHGMATCGAIAQGHEVSCCSWLGSGTPSTPRSRPAPVPKRPREPVSITYCSATSRQRVFDSNPLRTEVQRTTRKLRSRGLIDMAGTSSSFLGGIQFTTLKVDYASSPMGYGTAKCASKILGRTPFSPRCRGCRCARICIPDS